MFEGLRFDLTKPLNHNFALSHSIFMGNIDVPTANNQARTRARGSGRGRCGGGRQARQAWRGSHARPGQAVVVEPARPGGRV
jgi:hypothetical protein